MRFFFILLISLLSLDYVESIKMEKNANMSKEDEDKGKRQKSLRCVLAAYLIGLGKFEDAILVTDSMQKKDGEGNLAKLPDDLEGLMKEVEAMEIDPLAVGKKKREEEEKDKQIAKFVTAIGVLERRGDLVSAGNVLKK